MTTKYQDTKAGGNSSFGNSKRPPDIQGDEATTVAVSQKAKTTKHKAAADAKVGNAPPTDAAHTRAVPHEKETHHAVVHGGIGSGDIHRSR